MINRRIFLKSLALPENANKPSASKTKGLDMPLIKFLIKDCVSFSREYNTTL